MNTKNTKNTKNITDITNINLKIAVSANGLLLGRLTIPYNELNKLNEYICSDPTINANIRKLDAKGLLNKKEVEVVEEEVNAELGIEDEISEADQIATTKELISKGIII